MPGMPVLDGALRAEYELLFANASIRPERRSQVEAVAGKIVAADHWPRYVAVAAATGVPAFVVGLIHAMEASLRFDRHLHNGDPLTARTIQVPAGRPLVGQPPFTWEDSAIDALTYDHLVTWTDWTLPGIAYVLERFNGSGYRNHHPQVKSPYLWSFTTVYVAGKYVADGQWSDSAVSRQCGAMAILKALIALGKVNLAVSPAPPVPADERPVDGPRAVLFAARPAPPPYPGHALVKGAKGAAVEALQRRLLALGIAEVGTADGDFGDHTATAVRLFQARSDDETGAPLDIDGIVGRQTWSALFGGAVGAEPDPVDEGSDLGNLALRIAAGETGVREQPPGSNAGPDVEKYLASVGLGAGNPWCMAFVHWCFGEAALRSGLTANPVPASGSVQAVWQKAQTLAGVQVVSADAAATPGAVKPGMVFFIKTGPGSGHTGFVQAVYDADLLTIEGNTNDGGSRDGIGVFARTGRRISQINLGFVDFG